MSASCLLCMTAIMVTDIDSWYFC